MSNTPAWNPDPATLKPVSASNWNPDPSTLKPVSGGATASQQETGVWAGVKRNTVGLVTGLYHALADPATDQEKQELLAKIQAENQQSGTTDPNHPDHIPESLATDPSTATLAYHRLIDAPADALQQQGANTRAAAKDLISRGETVKGANQYASGMADTALSAVPLAGPAVNQIAQRYESGDHSGAATDLAALVLASKAPSIVKGAAEKASAMIPSAQRASLGFQQLSAAVGDHPVVVTPDLSKALLDVLNEKSTGGGNAPAAARMLETRLTDPSKGPLTYDEARQFASNISRLSARDASLVSNPARMKMLMGNLREALNDTIGDTAERGLDGGREMYRDVRSEYGRAQDLGEFGADAWTAVKKAIPWAAGTAIGYGAVKKLSDLLIP
jgi:hypothetical protein